MKSPLQAFLAYWRLLDTSKPPFLHPKDDSLASDRDFKLRLLPMPINGNLEEAEVVILMLDPGFNSNDYAFERHPMVRKALLRNITQKHRNAGYPFIYLHPAFAGHPGSDYWIGGGD